MKLKQKTIEWIINRFKIPSSAMRMFKAANAISGIDRNLLPTELIPLNAIQISRGLLNFTVIQSRLNWILPFWAEEQYNPESKSFIPRAHLGLSMNVTNRNWTAVGNPDCTIEPIVDPAGLVTPFKNGWSLDVWLKTEEKIYFPSRGKPRQRLLDDLPVTETKFIFNDIEVTTTAFTKAATLIIESILTNRSNELRNYELIFAVRPFNPEGISLINEIEFNTGNKTIIVNNKDRIVFHIQPDIVYCSSFEKGDSAEFLKAGEISNNFQESCSVGMANAAVIYKNALAGKETRTYKANINLTEPNQDNFDFSINDQNIYWNQLLQEGSRISTPDDKINSIIKASLASLLMLTDNEEITPGPFTYHQFWFRDAAYMLYALDKFGFSRYTKPVIQSFKKHQYKDGYYRSQKGEWDSNGQAVWSVYQHYLLTKDKEFLQENFNSVLKGVQWISNSRLLKYEHRKYNYYGLLPKGLSAEHLGLVDYYYWDNFWSLAGLEAFIKICHELNKEKELKFAQNIYDEYKKDILTSLKNVQQKFSFDLIPAGPERNSDCGMIGSVCAVYPLQLNIPEQPLRTTLEFIEQKYFVNGLFFQHFIHSGMNIYLTLQTAHAWLLLGDGEKFFKIFSKALSYATPVLNFPEAIHPFTSGGVMGDGHHGWAAAETVLALRDAFFYERQNDSGIEVLFFSGIPEEWFFSGRKFSIINAPTYSGILSITVIPAEDKISINIIYEKQRELNEKWRIILPAKLIPDDSIYETLKITRREKTELEISPGNLNLYLKSEVVSIGKS
ncbi:MAG: hypothetical protein R6W90_05215 [Ignavibacteriaceae bacterium]